jgi:hypothetical protein
MWSMSVNVSYFQEGLYRTVNSVRKYKAMKVYDELEVKIQHFSVNPVAII